MNSLLFRIAPSLFKPSLNHNKRSIRLLALQRLNLKETTDQEQFIDWLQNEKDLQLVQQALPLFPEVPPLLQVLQTASLAPNLEEALVKHLSELLVTHSKDQALIDQVEHPALLALLVEQAAEVTTRLHALERLKADEQQLLELALSNSLAKVRFQAASRITDEAALEKLVKEATGDKSVQRLGKEKLQAIKNLRQQQQQAAEQQQQLCNQLEQLVKGQDQSLFNARLEHLHQQWLQLADFPASSELAAKFAKNLELAQAQAAKLAAQAEQERQQQARKRAAQQRQQQLVQDLQKSLSTAQQQLAQQPSAAPANLDQLIDNWQSSQEEFPAPPELNQSFHQLSQEYQQLLTAWRNYQDKKAELQILLAENLNTASQLNAAKQLLKLIQWPTAAQAPEDINQLQSLVAQNSINQELACKQASTWDRQAFNALLNQLEARLDEGKSRDAHQRLQQLLELSEQAPNKERNQHQARLARLNARVNELKDWQGFVAAPKREKLCEQMEALAEDQAMEPQAKADRIQALQQEWRELGSAAASKALWQRFKQAADLAYEPCKHWFAQQAQQREYNQQQRAIICQELEELARSQAHLSFDETALDQLLTQVHDEWRRFNPVNRSEGKRLAQRFQKALQPIKEQLHQLRQHSAEQKRELIAQAEQLLESEDLQEAIELSKQLQTQWREIGRAPGSLEHQLWKNFRSACDQLFSRRDQEREQQNQARQERFLAARQQLALAKEALVSGQLEAANQAWQSAAKLKTVPNKEKQNWQEQLDTLKKELNAAERQHKNQKTLQKLLNQWHQLSAEQPLANPDTARRLTLHLEILLQRPIPEEDLALKMQLQVERLNAGIKGETNPKDQLDEAQELVSQWQKEIQSRQGALAERFEKALRSLAD